MEEIDRSIYSHRIPNPDGILLASPCKLEIGLPYRAEYFLETGGAYHPRECLTRMGFRLKRGTGTFRFGIKSQRYDTKYEAIIPPGISFSFNEVRSDTIFILWWGIYLPHHPVPSLFKDQLNPKLLKGFE